LEFQEIKLGMVGLNLFRFAPAEQMAPALPFRYVEKMGYRPHEPVRAMPELIDDHA